MPERIQRKRSKGWKMPKGVVYVGRPSKFGNPFKIVGDMIYGDASNRRGLFLSPWVHIDISGFKTDTPLNEIAVVLYKDWVNGLNPYMLIDPPSKDEIRASLKGKKLACWCKKSAACHADVLLELANK